MLNYKMKDGKTALNVSLIVFLMYTVYYLGRLNLGALIPVIRDTHGFTNTELGLVAASMYLAYTLMQVPSGFLADRIGVKRTLILGCIFIAVGNIIMITWFLSLLIIAQLINGFGQSTGWSSLVKFGYSHRREGRRILGILSSSVPAGTFLAYVVAGFTAEKFGLDYAFIIPALVMISVAFLISVAFPPHAISHDNKKFKPKFILNKNVIALSVIQLSILSTMNGLFVWMPALLVDLYEISAYEVYKFASLFPLPGIIGGVAGGYFASRYGDKPSIFLNQLMLSLLTLVIIVGMRLSLINFSHFFALLLILSMFFRFGSAGLFSLGVKTAGTEVAGTVSGFLNFVGSIGSVMVTGLIGFILDYYPSFYVLCIFEAIFIFSLLVSALLSEKDGELRLD
ncbi:MULTISPECIES: MFS transporter [unclassified Archaeoglobus]|uniref:MFS transporter n=1 Tax=unclassified Archaeoglobus TaxID=2643606 RepID=UPI0025BAF2FC|nr:MULTISPECIES: MFS transporter [unclassified Archaeoglobus]